MNALLRTGFAGICLVLSGCGSDRAAGGTGSETTNTVRVAVVGKDGRPVAGARLVVRAETDTASSDGAVYLTESDGGVDVPAVPNGAWLEARVGDSLAAMEVVDAGAGAARRLELEPTSALRVGGLVPGQFVSLPGLGRRVAAGADGVARFFALPSGAARARWIGFDGPVPLPAADTGRLVATDSVVSVDWPSDGSLDSLAIRRFLEQAGLGCTSMDTVARSLEGRLAHLDLSGRNLTSLPEAIGSLRFLREIDLGRNHLADLPVSLSNLPRLSLLNLDHNPLVSVPSVLRRLDSLRILDLDSCGLAALPSWIGELGRLWYLGVGENALDSLPSSLSNLGRLSVLAIFQNRIAALPAGMHRLDSLKEIWAETNRLRALPDSFGRILSLRTLQLDNNPLDSLPSDLGSIASLRDLRLTGTPLHALPKSLATLPLERLDVQGLALCAIDPALEPKLDSLAGPDWRSSRLAGCP